MILLSTLEINKMIGKRWTLCLIQAILCLVGCRLTSVDYSGKIAYKKEDKMYLLDVNRGKVNYEGNIPECDQAIWYSDSSCATITTIKKDTFDRLVIKEFGFLDHKWNERGTFEFNTNLQSSFVSNFDYSSKTNQLVISFCDSNGSNFNVLVLRNLDLVDRKSGLNSVQNDCVLRGYFDVSWNQDSCTFTTKSLFFPRNMIEVNLSYDTLFVFDLIKNESYSYSFPHMTDLSRLMVAPDNSGIWMCTYEGRFVESPREYFIDFRTMKVERKKFFFQKLSLSHFTWYR
jgi:hypothetical protein